MVRSLVRNRTEAAVGWVSWWVWFGRRLFPRGVRFFMHAEGVEVRQRSWQHRVAATRSPRSGRGTRRPCGRSDDYPLWIGNARDARDIKGGARPRSVRGDRGSGGGGAAGGRRPGELIYLRFPLTDSERERPEAVAGDAATAVSTRWFASGCRRWSPAGGDEPVAGGRRGGVRPVTTHRGRRADDAPRPRRRVPGAAAGPGTRLPRPTIGPRASGMCGIAGMFDLSGQRHGPPGVVPAMARAIVHRGPGRGRLPRTPRPRHSPTAGSPSSASPTASSPSRTRTAPSGPSSTASSSTTPRSGPQLEAKGHVFRTHTDTELIPHLWEEHRERMFDHLKRAVRVLPLGQPHQRGRPRPRPRRHLPAVLHRRRARRHRLAAVRLRDEGAVRLRAGRAARPTCTGSTTSSRSSRCPARSRCSTGIKCLVPGRYLHFKLGQHDARAGHDAEDLLAGDLPRPRAGGLRRRREAGRRRVRGGALRTAVQQAAAGRRAGRVVPLAAASIRASSWRWRTRRWAGRSRRSPSRCRPKAAERGARGAAGRQAPRLRAGGRRRAGTTSCATGYPELIARRRVPGRSTRRASACCTWRARSTSTATRSR